MSSRERGFSLVEVMIAMIVLAVGVIALAASSGAITRMTAEGNRSAVAALVASSRLETLRATACASMAAGTATTGKFGESWTVATTGLMRTVTITVTWSTGRGTRSSTFVSNISCAPSV